MNKLSVDAWKSGVNDYVEALDTIHNDEQILKDSFEKHIREFFDFDTIEYNKKFTKITLRWKRDHHPVIRHTTIHRLGMDWIISADYDDKAFRIVKVELYPFELPKEGEIHELE